uniref:NADH-ubiquinone oxidoreductase chain 5 n=1 Tax=Furcilarnaca wufengensis TaxID=2982682 RepID=A0A977XKC9_9ORTH|nr:NADH dehydrogenase subunit 5 [Furcilarnaca wufengensis]UXP34260.1 NADH dehydrogenase subunit 5 [Furcilarnaca wufengensis]UXP34342.1 NADH dehydrogenase subunit 5 [Furcilarnaca wufengensis]
MMWSFSICLLGFVVLLSLSLVMGWLGCYYLMADLVYFIEWEVISLNSSGIVMTVLLDWMSLMFMSFVMGISSLVVYYSEEYMLGDGSLDRFIILVLMFVLSMMFMIISPNLISILLGWDGLGLVSYCLVIYYQNTKSYGAGMLTALSNRVGDVALLMAIAWMLNFGSWNYIYYLNLNEKGIELSVMGGLILLAAMTKSAQIPFSSWLPAAMAAPTPVSALVHSSTLVTAGVYLLIRFNTLIFEGVWSELLLLISGLTMFMAGMGANFEFDLKKIIALSTLSQLGLMMSILSIGYFKLAFFHLLTHALFKALLFMCAGAIIHNMKNSQDIRSMGVLSNQMPLTSACFNSSNLALCGMPFLAGFYSKDLILEMVSLSYMNCFLFFLFFFSTGLTVSYSLRLVYYSMTGDCNEISSHFLNDEGWVMLSGMILLMTMAVMGGSMLSWVIFSTPEVVVLPFSLKMMTMMVCLTGGWIGYEIAKLALSYELYSFKFYLMSSFLGSVWFMPSLSTYGVNYYFLSVGELIYSIFDQGWSEEFGGQTVYLMSVDYSLMNQVYQNNELKVYLISFVVWVIILMGLIVII